MGLLGSYLPLSLSNPHGVLFLVLQTGFAQTPLCCQSETFLVSIPVVVTVVPLVLATTPLPYSHGHLSLPDTGCSLAGPVIQPTFILSCGRWLGLIPCGLCGPVKLAFSYYFHHHGCP